jgi:uncharacterized membrane protein YeiH
MSAVRATWQLFPYFDWGATLLWGASGAMLAARRGCDLSGIYVVALVSAAGGGLLRDGLFLQDGPPALLRTPVYLWLVAAAVALVWVFGSILRRLSWFVQLVDVVDALGLGAYAVVGMNLARQAGLPFAAEIVVGMVNAVGGSVLRDLLLGDPPQAVRPGVWMSLAALIGCVALVLMVANGVSRELAGIVTVVLVFAVRMAALRFALNTAPLKAFEADWRVD